MTTDPTSDDPVAVLRVAFAHLEEGAHADAEACTRRALQLSPGHLDALTMLGLALHGQGKFVEAIDVWAEVTARDPDRLLAWVNYGTALRTQRRLDEALFAYARAAALGAGSPDFLYNVGLLHQERGDYEHALRLLSEAHTEAPLDGPIALQLAQCNYELLQTEDALAAVRDWPRFDPLDDATLADLVLLLLNLGEGAAAKEALRRLLRVPQPSPHALLRLAQYMERSNRVDEARDGLLALKGDARAAALGEELSLLEAQLAQRARRHEEAATLFGRLAEQCREPERRHLYLFPLAKSLDALGRYEDAFRTLQQAHAAQLGHLHRIHPETAGLDEPPLLITRRGVDAADVAAWRHDGAPDAGAAPVFIVAFPRSGTTLLEQALDAHPALVTMDEQPFLQGCIDDLMAAGADYPAHLAALSPAQLSAIRARYFQQAARKVRLEPGQRLLDKNPLNLLRLPAIRRLFPQSPVLLAIRNPADVVLSCFQQHFRAPEFALMCRDLPTLSRSFRRAFDYWYAQQALLPGPVHELRYEDLVADFEPNMRAIAAFLQLPWHDAMLEPAAQARRRGFISTPSYSQVVEPVHTRSVNRWRNYAPHFETACAELAGCAARWGYDLGNSR